MIDGHNGMGQLISVYAMKKAIEKAKKTGVGIVTVCESNHFGIAGYYAKMACDEGLLGMACTCLLYTSPAEAGAAGVRKRTNDVDKFRQEILERIVMMRKISGQNKELETKHRRTRRCRMLEKERTYIAIDLKSFYASVECNCLLYTSGCNSGSIHCKYDRWSGCRI